MSKNDQSELLTELVNEADTQVKQTLEQIRALNVEASMQAALMARSDATAEFIEIESRIQQALENAATTAWKQRENEENKIDEVMRHTKLLDELICEQIALSRRVIKGLWIVGILLLFLLISVVLLMSRAMQ